MFLRACIACMRLWLDQILQLLLRWLAIPGAIIILHVSRKGVVMTTDVSLYCPLLHSNTILTASPSNGDPFPSYEDLTENNGVISDALPSSELPNLIDCITKWEKHERPSVFRITHLPATSRAKPTAPLESLSIRLNVTCL